MARERKRSLRAALADFKMYAQFAPSDPDVVKAVQRVSLGLGAK
jgi:hypothetical protein